MTDINAVRTEATITVDAAVLLLAVLGVLLAIPMWYIGMGVSIAGLGCLTVLKKRRRRPMSRIVRAAAWLIGIGIVTQLGIAVFLIPYFPVPIR